MTARHRILFASACATALAGCGGTPQAENPNAAGDATNAPSLHYESARTVAIDGTTVSPRTASVPVNGTIHWVNRGTRSQSIRWTSGPGGHFTSGQLEPGERFSILMPFVGTVTYRSSGGAQGTIDVGEH